MSVPASVVALARLAAVGYFTLSAMVCLLYFMPFTYVQLLESELVPVLVSFERVHAWLWLPVVGLVTWTHRGRQRSALVDRLWLIFGLVMGVAGLALLVWPVMPELGNTRASFVWSQVALVPLLWLAAIDLVAARGRVRWASAATGEWRLLRAGGGAALFVWLLTTMITVGRLGSARALEGTELWVGIAWSLAAHLVLFAAVSATLLFVRGVSALVAHPARAEAWLTALGLAAVIAVIVRRVVFAALSFNGPFADVAALSLGVTLSVFVVAGAFTRASETPRVVDDGVELVLSPLAPARTTAPVALAWLGLIGVAMAFAMLSLAAVDWNFLMQRVVVATVWVVAFAVCYRVSPVSASGVAGVVAAGAIPLAVLGGYRGVEVVTARVLRAADLGVAVSSVVDRYAGYDASAGLLAGTLRPRAATVESDLDLFSFLQAYTGIPRSVELAAREVRFAADPSAPALVRPHIFVIVVDSLRRDYLGAYNPQVRFTPEIDRFAEDSMVFRRTFSRYGATGLSEPSIWIGGMLPHQQYMAPFAPMNALQTLLRAQDYDAYLSLDPILDKIVAPEGWVTELDRGRQAGDIEMCGTLDELQRRLTERTDPSRPIFAYTQPQNIHIATISRGGVESVDDGPYDGFYAPYASRLRAVDTCVGTFLRYLEGAGLYDDSVIILTSDHGDSLGEDGRFGHAYTIFPEILEIPLLLHVPADLMADRGVDLAGLAFSTDLTPTLYELLGLEPEPRQSFFGRSLLVESADERQAYASASHLVVSSYGPVYGLLTHQGRSLYILDAVNYRDYVYDLSGDTAATPGMATPAERLAMQAEIRTQVEALNDWYGVPRLH